MNDQKLQEIIKAFAYEKTPEEVARNRGKSVEEIMS